MKVVVRSSSLVFTVLSIVLHVPISRVKRPAPGAPLDPVRPRDLTTLQDHYRKASPVHLSAERPLR
jgi:hypothetical protein